MRIRTRNLTIILSQLHLGTRATTSGFLFIVRKHSTMRRVITHITSMTRGLLLGQRRTHFIRVTHTNRRVFTINIFTTRQPNSGITTIMRTLTQGGIMTLLIPANEVSAQSVTTLTLARQFKTGTNRHFTDTTRTIRLKRFLGTTLFNNTVMFVRHR